ncbi:hypothetical protein [Xanthomarina gelatinilytica]|uniref:hypothetical protein n=1 Tax=Xanthomarina gelatinilytica TaxID=1137281 RepID=UPI003AA89C50
MNLSKTNIAKNRTGKSAAVQKLEDLILEDLKKRYPNNPYPPKRKYTDQTSNGLTRCIMDFLKVSGHQAERINSTGRMIDNTKTVKDCIGRVRKVGSVQWVKGTGRTGTADISATILGRSVKIEVKCAATGDRYQSEEQKDYQKEIEAAGGTYVIARTFEGFMEWFNGFLKEITIKCQRNGKR